MPIRPVWLLFLLTLLPVPALAQPSPPRTREAWVAMAKAGFARPDGVSARALLVEMNALLASTDPVLRDEVAYGAAERWLLREKALAPADLRAVQAMWMANLSRGLGTAGTDEVFGRSFSALCLSLVAAADLATPFLSAAELQAFFDGLLDYFARERDTRGFDSAKGWMHTVAHTADALKFVARNPRLPGGADRRLLDAIRAKLETTDGVFAWGESDRLAWALHSAVRRADADGTALADFAAHWVREHRALWANGPHVEEARFARVENARQVLRSLYAALAMDRTPTATGAAAAATILAALAEMR
jgi:hypothetical protein